MIAPIIGQPVAATVAVDLEDTVKPSQHPFRMGTAAARSVCQDHPGRIASTPWPLSRSIAQRFVVPRPESSTGGCRLIHEEFARPQRRHPVHHRGEVERGAADPVAQRRAINGEPMPRHDLRLAIEGKMLGIPGDEHMGDRSLGGQTALDQRRWRLFLHDTGPALRAGVTRTHRDEDAELRRGDVETFGAILSDPDHVTAAARTGEVLRLDHPLLSREVFRGARDMRG
jgi:hypothetical protein